MRKAMGFRGWTLGLAMSGAMATAACDDEGRGGPDTSAATTAETSAETTAETAAEVGVETAPDTGPDTAPVADLEIGGAWTSDFGEESISNTAWTNFGTQSIVVYDNDDNVAITLSPADAQFAPNTYSRIVWTEPVANAFYYCTTAYGIATQAEAEDAAEAGIDRNDLDGKGCAGFPWSHLTRK